MAELLDFLFGAGKELYVLGHAGETPPLPWAAARVATAHEPDGSLLGFIAWRAPRAGWLWNLLPGRLRPLDILVLGSQGNEMMTLSRRAFQSAQLYASSGLKLGTIPWHAGSGARRIELVDENRETFVVHRKGSGPLFPFRNAKGQVAAGVALAWKGKAHNRFSSDNGFSVFFGDAQWTPARRCILLCAAALMAHDYS